MTFFKSWNGIILKPRDNLNIWLEIIFLVCSSHKAIVWILKNIVHESDYFYDTFMVLFIQYFVE